MNLILLLPTCGKECWIKNVKPSFLKVAINAANRLNQIFSRLSVSFLNHGVSAKYEGCVADVHRGKGHEFPAGSPRIRPDSDLV